MTPLPDHLVELRARATADPSDQNVVAELMAAERAWTRALADDIFSETPS